MPFRLTLPSHMHMSQRENEAVTLYESQRRALTPEFISSIAWQDIQKYPLNKKFIRVLLYMRDIEAFTEVYYKELRKTPTGRDPAIRRFMDRWQAEEALHAELLNRFVNEAGVETSKNWFQEAKHNIPLSYWVRASIKPTIANMVGKQFSAVHMTWGTIQELSTLQGYRRLWEQSQHPVLEYLLRGIAAEEAIHIYFYRTIARLKLEESKFSQQLARFLIDRFWNPVGQGLKSAEDTNFVIATLFAGEPGVDAADNHINKMIANLPGFHQFTRVKNRIAEIASQAVLEVVPAKVQV